MFSECSSYMDACIYNSESKKLLGEDFAGPQALLGMLKKEKYEAAVHLHYSSILSNTKSHEEALKHAQTAFKKGLLCMKMCHKACLDHLSRHNKLMGNVSIRKRLLKQPQYNLIESPHYQNFHRQVTSALPFLQYFHNKYHSTSKNPQKISLKSYLHTFYSEEDWINSATIEEISILKPLNPANINNTLGIHTEISKENIISKLVLIITSMFFIANELKFIQNSKEEAKAWHKKTIQSASELFPPNSTLIKQLKEGYLKEYKMIENVIKKNRHHTISSRVRTPVPIHNSRKWPRNKSHYDKQLESGKINVKSLQNHFKCAEVKISATPQPRPSTSQGNDRKKIKDPSDFVLNSYDLY